VELTVFDILLDLVKPLDDGILVFFTNQADAGKHLGVGDRAGDVVLVEAAVVGDGLDEGGGQGVGGLGDAGLPGFVLRLRAGFAHGRIVGEGTGNRRAGRPRAHVL
jgi:hypothetical protein